MSAPGDRFSSWLEHQPKARRFLIVLMLAYFTVNALIAAWTHTPTVDEFVQVPMGLYHLRTGKFDLDRRNPPLIKMMTATPVWLSGARLNTDPQWRGNGEGWWMWIFGTRFMRDNEANYFSLFFLARLVVILLGLAGGLCLYAWARQWYGAGAALGTLLLYATCPNLLGHASLATLDIGVTVLVFGGFFVLHQFSQSLRKKWAVLSGILFGAALASKFTALFFLPLVPLLLAIERRPQNRKAWLAWAGSLGWITLSAWLVVNAAYFFHGFPLPSEFMDGIKLKTLDRVRAESPAFFLGLWSNSGWWCYYPIAFLLKSTIPFLLLISAGIFGFLDRKKNAMFMAWIAWIVLPPLWLFYLLFAHFKIDFGIRYLLPALPFLMLVAGNGIRTLLGSRRMEVVLLVLLSWQLLTSLLHAPDHLAYFNESVGGPDRARRLLLDSNLDWGQDLGRLKPYMDEHGIGRIRLGYFGHTDPKLYGISYDFPPPTPEPGIYAISANYLAGYPHAVTYAGDSLVQEVPAGAWIWLDEHKPIARVGSSIYIFKIEPKDLLKSPR